MPNGSNTYDPTILYTVAAGATTNATNVAFIRPATRLNPAVPYAVECRLFRDGTTPTGIRSLDTARLYFAGRAKLESGQVAADMVSMASGTPDPAAVERLSQNVETNIIFRTTCTATEICQSPSIGLG